MRKTSREGGHQSATQGPRIQPVPKSRLFEPRSRLRSRRTLEKLDGVALHHLLKLLAVVELDSVDAAAGELKKTSASVSLAMTKLSALCGVQVLDESGKVTGAAHAMYPIVRQIVSLAGRVERIANPFKMRIAITRSLGGALTKIHDGLKHRFRNESKKLEFSFLIETSDQVIRQVSEGHADVGVVIAEALKNYPARGIYPYPVEPEEDQASFTNPAKIFLRRGHRLGRALKRSAQGLANAPMAWFDARLSPALYDEIDKAFRAEGIGTGFKISHTSSDMETVFGLLACEEAVTIMPAAFEGFGFSAIDGIEPVGWRLPPWRFTVIRHRSFTSGRVSQVWDETLKICREL